MSTAPPHRASHPTAAKPVESGSSPKIESTPFLSKEDAASVRAPKFKSVKDHRRQVIDRTMQDTVRLISTTLIPVAAMLGLGTWFFLEGSGRALLAVLCGLTGLVMMAVTWTTRRKPVPARHVHWMAVLLVSPVYGIATLRWILSGELHHAMPLALATVASGGLFLSTRWMTLTMIALVACWLGAAWTQPFERDLYLVAVFQGVAVLVGVMLHVMRLSAHHRIGDLMAEAEDQRYLLARQAKVDELTGVLNRRALMSALRRKLAGAKRYGFQLAVLMIDLDNFKRINDTWGHASGDEALREFSRRLQRAARVTDIIGRYGGEEFVCILPESDLPNVEIAAERIRMEIANEPFTILGQLVPITASIGVSVLDPNVECEEHLLLDAADRALLEAKARGKNCVVVADDLEPVAASG